MRIPSDEQPDLPGLLPELRRPGHALFLAFRLGRDTAAQIADLTARLCRSFGLTNRPIPPSRLHMTVLPIGAGDTPPSPMVIARPSRALDSLAAAPFEITLDRLQSFRNRRASAPLVLAARQRHAGMISLQRGLRNAVRAQGLIPPRHEGATPHVTLTWDRDLRLQREIDPITLRIHEIVLIHSHVGKSRHDTLGHWRLDK